MPALAQRMPYLPIMENRQIAAVNATALSRGALKVYRA